MVRNIASARPAHKPAALRLPVALALGLAIAFLPGCGRRPAVRPVAGVQPGGAMIPGCRISVDRSPFDSYLELAEREHSGRPVPAEEYARLWTTPPYASLLATISPKLLTAPLLTEASRAVNAPPVKGAPATRPAVSGQPAVRQTPAFRRRDLADALTWTWDHREAVTGVVDSLARTPVLCRVLPALAGYVRSTQLPDTLLVGIVASGPDIRWAKERIVIDAGVAAAAGVARLPRLVGAQLYRALEPLAGPEPTAAAAGRATVAAVFAMLRREGIAAWIEGYPDVVFDSSHPLLGRTDTARRQWAQVAQGALTRAQEMLATLLADRAVLDEKGSVVDDLFRGNAAYAPTGYAMATLIATRLGEARLRAVSHGPPAEFVRAYQEATARPDQLALDLADRPWIVPATLNALPAFPPRVYKALLDLLKDDPTARR